ncbi:MAG: glycosyltransferase [Actinomycetota bacterium]|nr:glycosyltransferase [Actinomycetota bacterium]
MSGAELSGAELSGAGLSGAELSGAELSGAELSVDPAVVGVVTVTYGSGEALDHFLDSLPLASEQPLDVLIADNGSTDQAPQRGARREGVRLLCTGGNLGYGRAANLGVAAVGGDWIMVCNPDVLWTAGAIDELLAVAKRWPRAGAVGPLIRDGNGEVYPSARELPTFFGGIAHAVLGSWWPANPWTRAYRRERSEPQERVAGWLSGACLLLRRAAFDSVGGFDPRYFMYFEDVDLGERLANAGWLNVYAPSAEVVHTGSHSTDQHKSSMFTEHHRSAYRYLSGRYSGVTGAPVRAMLWVGLMARARLTPRLIEFAQRRKGKDSADGLR